MIARISMAIGVSVALAMTATPVIAKEYNKRQHLAPEQGAKVVRTIAGARTQEFNRPGSGRPGDVVNTGCGKLEIGNVRPDQQRRGPRRDNVIVITGDVINVARGCRNNR